MPKNRVIVGAPHPVLGSNHSFGSGGSSGSVLGLSDLGDWTSDEDQTLMFLRAMGKDWEEIQKEEFPTKSIRQCQGRLRHVLMESQGRNYVEEEGLQRVSDEDISTRDQSFGAKARRMSGESQTSSGKVRQRSLSQDDPTLSSAFEPGDSNAQKMMQQPTNDTPRPESPSQSEPEGEIPISPTQEIAVTTSDFYDSDVTANSSDSFVDHPEASYSSFVQGVMEWFYLWIDEQFQAQLRTCALSGNDEGDRARGHATNSEGATVHTSEKQRGKRPLTDLNRREDGSNDSEDESSGNNKKQKLRVGASHVSSRFACPFFKRNPARYQDHRSCPGPGWVSVHRLKEHLYRRHMLLKFRCPRCCRPFGGPDELHAHHRSETSCTLQTEIAVEGITEGQERKLRARSPNAKTEGQRWKDVYRILFPDDDPSTIPSPYYEVISDQARSGAHQSNCPHKAELSSLANYARRKAPQLLQQELENWEPELKKIMNEQLRRKLSEVIPRLQLKLIEDFRNASASSSPTHFDPPTAAADEGDASGNQIITTSEDPQMADPSQLLSFMDWTGLGHLEFDFPIILPHEEVGNAAEYVLAGEFDTGQDKDVTKDSALVQIGDSGYASSASTLSEGQQSSETLHQDETSGITWTKHQYL